MRREDTADDFRDDCEGSALILLTILHQTAAKISTADDSNIEARQDDLYKEGFSTVSVKEFNAFKWLELRRLPQFKIRSDRRWFLEHCKPYIHNVDDTTYT